MRRSLGEKRKVGSEGSFKGALLYGGYAPFGGRGFYYPYHFYKRGAF